MYGFACVPAEVSVLSVSSSATAGFSPGKVYFFFAMSCAILEVSSPGLGRPLKKEKDFKRSLGEAVDIKLYRAIERQKDFSGILTAYDADTVTIRYEDGSESTFNRKDIALIRLAFDF